MLALTFFAGAIWEASCKCGSLVGWGHFYTALHKKKIRQIIITNKQNYVCGYIIHYFKIAVRGILWACSMHATNKYTIKKKKIKFIIFTERWMIKFNIREYHTEDKDIHCHRSTSTIRWISSLSLVTCPVSITGLCKAAVSTHSCSGCRCRWRRKLLACHRKIFTINAPNYIF